MDILIVLLQIVLVVCTVLFLINFESHRPFVRFAYYGFFITFVLGIVFRFLAMPVFSFGMGVLNVFAMAVLLFGADYPEMTKNAKVYAVVIVCTQVISLLLLNIFA